MDRRTFIKGTLATAALVAGPFGAPPQGFDPAWVADGDGWRQVSSLLAIKKGDIFVISWPVQCKALADGMIDPADGREGVFAISFSLGGPSRFPPYPWCDRCQDPRVVPPEERVDVGEGRRAICDLCIADPARAERKVATYREFLRLHPPVRIETRT